MVKNNKILFIIFFVLLVVTAGEIYYYFFYKTSSQEKTSTVSNIVTEIRPTTVSVPLKTDTQMKGEIVNLISLLLNKNSKLVDGTLLLDNSTRKSPNDEIGYITDPIKIDSPFKILLNLNGEGGYVALTLSGKINMPKKEWWEGIHTMYIVARQDGITFELRDGRSPNSLLNWTYNATIPGTTYYIEFLNQEGREFAFLNEEGKVLKHVDLSKVQEAKFPQGLFPDKQMWLGVLLKPGTKLQINQLMLIKSVK